MSYSANFPKYACKVDQNYRKLESEPALIHRNILPYYSLAWRVSRDSHGPHPGAMEWNFTCFKSEVHDNLRDFAQALSTLDLGESVVGHF